MDDAKQAHGPDLTKGVAETDLAEGAMLVGDIGGEAVLLARCGGEVFAIGATCTHYSGPLGEGLLVGDTVRCPWHHACFSLRTGEALRAPALAPVSCWRVERRDGLIVVREKALAADSPHGRPRARSRAHQSASSLSAAAPQVSPPPRCCVARPTQARSSC